VQLLTSRDVTLRRPRGNALAQDAAAAACVVIGARRAALPGLYEGRTEPEVHGFMRDSVLVACSVLLAECAGEVVGIAAREREWLRHLYVRPGWTGRGIGQMLIARMLGEMTAEIPPMRLYAFARNAGARRFYERNGFVVIASGDGADNEEREPDVLYEHVSSSRRRRDLL
jgi:GNAT superfamily N-acetyltransferase